MPTTLVRGRNCWIADAQARAAGLVVDGRSYYLGFYEAARLARRYILIAGWRFNTDVRLIRGRDADAYGGEVRFLPFLEKLCAANPDLEIYILAWDFSLIFVHEWEWFQARKFEAAGKGRIHFLFDSNHAVGASHHQKFVVVDGQTAFVGGLDFNADDWDDHNHRPDNPDRVDSGQKEPHRPYHDVQAFLAGPVARDLAVHFRERWRRAGGDDIELPVVAESAMPPLRAIRIPPAPVALSLNRARTVADPTSVGEIRQLYLDAIDAAEELIFIENQYFSSDVVYEALLRRMRAEGRSQLDIVLILPQHLASWVESVTQGPTQVRMIGGLREAARQTGHRLGTYYRATRDCDGREHPVIVHSKVLAVDDRLLSVGSANTSNRSMGLDTELNVSWEADSPQSPLVKAIRRVRMRLLAEHIGCAGRAEVRRGLRRRRGLVDVLEPLAHDPACELRVLTEESITQNKLWLELLARWGFAVDPDRPVVEETLFEPLESMDSLLDGGLDWLRNEVNGNEKPAGRPNPYPSADRSDTR